MSDASAISRPLTDPPMTFGCFPLGGWWPEIVFRATWLFEVMITLAIAVPPSATKSATTETTFAKLKWRRMRRIGPS